MATDDRLDRLEQRITTLEGLVRQLLTQGPLERPAPESTTARRPAPSEARGPDGQTAVTQAADAPGTASPTRPSKPPKPSKPPRHIDSEQWFGQRGLLAVGVIFLILAAGYLLKLSFERGWISPAMRCIGGACFGVAIGLLGFRLFARGLRTYGAALIGCGAAIVYLVVWSASRLYQFLPPDQGIAGLALVSLVLAAIALFIDVEALGATAALGAFFAPLILGTPASNPDALLLYLGFMGASLGWVAARQRWRLAMALIALSYFSFATTPPFEAANSYRLLVYGLFGGCAGLYVGLREGWWETRVMTFAGGWGLLALANEQIDAHWPIVVGAIILAAPVWWRGLHSTKIWPGIRESEAAPSAPSFGESLYFYLTPFLLGWAVQQLAPETFSLRPGLPALIVAVPYLFAGFTAVRIPFALVGTTAVLIAIDSQWNDLRAAWTLLGLAIVWASMDHLLRRVDGRWYGLLAAVAGLLHLSADLESRSLLDPAFIGQWAFALWCGIAILAAYGSGLWRRDEGDDRPIARIIPALCWTLAGTILLFGVTGEIRRYFAHGADPQLSADLASGLAISAWWIVFAAALVILGFRRGLKQVRVAGLVVSALAVLKVVLFDLSTLDALYRVGSVLILGIVSLGLAYLYHRKGRAGSEVPPPATTP